MRRQFNFAGLGTLLQAAHSDWEASARRPSPRPETPTTTSLGPETSGGGPHRTQTFKEQEKRTLVLHPPQPTSGPCSNTAVPQEEPSDLPSPLPQEGCGERPAGSSALANYCDVSAPLPGWIPLGRVLQDHPPHPDPFPPQPLTWSLSRPTLFF